MIFYPVFIQSKPYGLSSYANDLFEADKERERGRVAKYGPITKLSQGSGSLRVVQRGSRTFMRCRITDLEFEVI